MSAIAETSGCSGVLFSQWTSMSSYMREYIESQNSPDKNLIVELIAFNTQYLLKIAGHKDEDALVDHKQISPLGKGNATYQRDYKDANKLLAESTSRFSYPYVVFTAGKSYRHILSCKRQVIFLNDRDSDQVLKDKVHGFIERIESITKKQLYEKVGRGIGLYLWKLSIVVIEVSEFDSQTIEAKINKIIDMAKSYPFENVREMATFTCKMQVIVETSLYGNMKALLSDESVHTWVKIYVRGSGAAPTLQQSAELYARLVSAQGEGAFFRQHLTTSTAPFQLKPSNDMNQRDFLNASMSELKVIVKEESSPSKIRILGKGIIALVEGLLSLNLESTFKEQDVGRLYADSLNRVDQLLKKFTEAPEETFDLIIEEITLILRVSKPYKAGHLESIIKEKLIGEWPDPTSISMTSSCMQCLVDTLYAAITVKSDGLNIMYFDDIYFEFPTHINALQAFHPVNTFKVETNRKEYLSQLNEFSEKLDCVFIDIHSSAQGQRKVQRCHDVIAVVDALKSNNALNDGFLLFIDNTFGCWGSKEIEDILKHFQGDIEQKKVIIVIAKSLHKLDILGCDKFNGGCHLVYGDETLPFVDELIKLDNNTPWDSTDYQAYSHFYNFASEAIKEYYEKIVSNTNFMYSKLNPNLIFDSEDDHWSYGISKKEDSRTAYWEFIPNGNKDGTLVLIDNLRKQGLYYRDSFGYPFTTIQYFPYLNTLKFRVTPGLEEEGEIERIAHIFNATIAQRYTFMF